MRLYVKMYFSSESDNPMDIVNDVQNAGFTPVVGDYDFQAPIEQPGDYKKKVEDLYAVVRGRHVFFRLVTRKD